MMNWPKRPIGYYLLAILAISVLLRVGAAAVMGDQVESLPGIDDQKSYHMLAQQVLGGRGFTVAEDWWPMTRAGQPTAHWSYLYTLYLATVYTVFGVHPAVARLIQAMLVGALWPLLAFRMGRRLGGDSVGLVAAGWTTVYGYFIYYTTALMTEPFYITAILGSLDLVMSQTAPKHSYKRWALLGIVTGVAVLLRQSFLPFVPFLLLWMWISDGNLRVANLRLPRSLVYPLLTLAVIGILILPWTIRNYLAFGHFVPLNTNAGFAFYWANHPIYGTNFVGLLPSNAAYQSLVPTELHSLNEAALDSVLLRRGMEFVIQDPWRYVLLSLSRVKTYFMFWPSEDSQLLSNVVRVLSFGVSLPFMLYGLFVALKHWRAWSLLYLFVIVYTGIHLLSWALIRYRLPVDAVLILFASLGLVDLAQKLKLRQRRVDAPVVPQY